ncbi:hypothetical protein CRYUN_Cryun08bG0086100 [Craigia yunnanensis]
MGCSASRPNTALFTKSHNAPEDPYSCSSIESMVSSHSSPPVHRALSLPTPLVHHPPLRKGDTHHLVSLTSTTYGSLVLIDTKTPEMYCRDFSDHQLNQSSRQQDSPVHADQDKSLSPDSVINTWELMDGLDDDCDFDLGKPNSFVKTRTKELSSKSNTFNCKGLDVPVKKYEDYKPTKPSLTKPLWKHLSEESLLSKLDPNVVSSYRRALSSRQLGSNESRSTISVGSSPSCSSMRDISMDSMYRNECQSLLGGKMICLPQVFIRGKHVGSVEEIKQLNESGELAKLLEGFPVREPRIVCEGCGDARFVLCPNCNGSRKVFEEDEARLRRCPDCNENGLIRCPGCCL